MTPEEYAAFGPEVFRLADKYKLDSKAFVRALLCCAQFVLHREGAPPGTIIEAAKEADKIYGKVKETLERKAQSPAN